MTNNFVAIAAKVKDQRSIDDFAPKRHTGYWPHLDRLIDLDDYMRANSARGMGMVNLKLGAFIGVGTRMESVSEEVGERNDRVQQEVW